MVRFHLGRHSASSCEVCIHTVIRTVIEKKEGIVGRRFVLVCRACVGSSCTIQTVLAVAGIMRNLYHLVDVEDRGYFDTNMNSRENSRPHKKRPNDGVDR